jgi:hypothetical protein
MSALIAVVQGTMASDVEVLARAACTARKLQLTS